MYDYTILILSVSFSHKKPHSLKLHSLSLTHKNTLSLFHTHTETLFHTLSPSPLTHTLSYIRTLSLSHTRSIFLFLLSLFLSQNSLSLSHRHTKIGIGLTSLHVPKIFSLMVLQHSKPGLGISSLLATVLLPSLLHYFYLLRNCF